MGRPLRACAPALGAMLAGSVMLGCVTLPALDEINAFTLSDEWRLGEEIRDDLERRLELVQDAEALRAMNRLGLQLVAHGRLADRPWRFHLVRDDELNAFNTPGGHVWVNTGLVLAARDGAELMGVLAHETAHGMERHATLQVTRAYGLQVVLQMTLGRQPGALEGLAANLATGGTLAHYSREAEREADREGVRLLDAAGWDPEGLPRFLEALLAERQHRPSRVERFFASHPMTQSRIADLREAIAGLPTGGDRRSQAEDFDRLRSRLRR